jgi:hypothetical protein
MGLYLLYIWSPALPLCAGAISLSQFRSNLPMFHSLFFHSIIRYHRNTIFIMNLHPSTSHPIPIPGLCQLGTYLLLCYASVAVHYRIPPTVSIVSHHVFLPLILIHYLCCQFVDLLSPLKQIGRLFLLACVSFGWKTNSFMTHSCVFLIITGAH